MPPTVPESLRELLTSDAETAWARFLQEFSDVLLRTAHSLGGDRDLIMDRYAFMLEALRRDRCQRLRGYVADGRSTFSTWLIVVGRRLCLDHYRHRYGRSQSDTPSATERHRERRQLTDLVGSEVGLDRIEAPPLAAPDLSAVRQDLDQRLQRALEALGPEDRLILRLRFEEELSVPQISRLLHLGSPFSLYRRIDRLLGDLRVRLQGLGVRDAGL